MAVVGKAGTYGMEYGYIELCSPHNTILSLIMLEEKDAKILVPVGPGELPRGLKLYLEGYTNI